jgi:hypothetical protein
MNLLLLSLLLSLFILLVTLLLLRSLLLSLFILLMTLLLLSPLLSESESESEVKNLLSVVRESAGLKF